MKKLIFSAILLTGFGTAVYAQGTVAFQNYTTGSVLGEVLSNGVSTPWIGPINLELLWGPLGDTAQQLLGLNTGLVFSTVITAPAAGHFSDSTVAVTSGPLGSGSGDVNRVELLIAAWVGPAVDYDAALLSGYPVSETLPFANPTGGGGIPAAAPANMVGWTAANSIVFGPEPGTIVLGALGGAMLLLFRRRK